MKHFPASIYELTQKHCRHGDANTPHHHPNRLRHHASRPDLDSNVKASCNPEGIVSSSPGLRGTSYPGKTRANYPFNLEEVAPIGRTSHEVVHCATRAGTTPTPPKVPPTSQHRTLFLNGVLRSEERRVGKECRS